MITKIKEWAKDIKLTGVSTSFIGISWENIGEQNKEDILRELYLIRSKISKFYFSYDDSRLKFDDEEELRDAYFLKALQVYDEIAEFVLSSKFFVTLPIDNREMFLNVFDFVSMQEAYMENDEDYYMEPEDIQFMIEDLLTLFSTIEIKIAELNNV